MVELGK
ncbi:hypothetical protein VCHC57A2_3555, partial [Vibrio cholerae HC-57A2]